MVFVEGGIYIYIYIYIEWMIYMVRFLENISS